MIEGSFEVKPPTIWTDEKQRWEESEKRREEEDQKRKSLRRKKIQVRESRLPKAAGAEPCGQIRDEKLHTVVARSTFRSQNVQNTSASEHF